MNRFIDHLQVVTTNNYNTIADFHTKSSKSNFISLYVVTALHNGYSSAVFLLDVSRERIFSLRCPPVNTPQLKPQLHCTHSLNWTRSVESYSLGADQKRTPLATPLLLLRKVTAYFLPQSLHSNGCTRHVSWTSSVVACRHYLATNVSLAPHFLL
jgi:hypothetical protein